MCQPVYVIKLPFLNVRRMIQHPLLYRSAPNLKSHAHLMTCTSRA